MELKREQEDPQAEARRRRRERLLALVERATEYYVRVLWDSPEAARARDYLAGRGLGEEVLRTFRVGYAPSAWDKLMLKAQRDGFSQEGSWRRRRTGAKGRQGGFYDRFRARIMFPLADPRGKVLGFGARSMRDDQGPKYVNTSENELYHKGRQLFGIDHARGPAARAGRVVAVEGYTDVLALHQAGVTETVAIMGTALTQEQMAELGRAAGTVYLALDADRAGQDAMLRAARVRPRSASSSCWWWTCRRARTRPTWWRATGPRRSASGSTRPATCRTSRRGGSSPRPTSIRHGPRSGIGRSAPPRCGIGPEARNS